MIKAVLFDMDGVIFDTEKLGREGWFKAGKELGFYVDDDRIRQIRGSNVNRSRQLFKEWYGDTELYTEARAVRDGYQHEQIEKNGIGVKPGYAELRRYMKEKGIKSALTTSTQRSGAEYDFGQAGLSIDFDATVCGTEIKHGKPEPDIYILAASRLNEKPEDCMVLEDSPNGLKAANGSGCKVIMIPDLDPATPSLAAMCSRVCRDMFEVKEYLEQEAGEKTK